MRTSIADGLPYIDFCNAVMNDNSGELIKTFRKNPDYDLVVPGNRNGSEVFEHVELIKSKYPEMLKHMDMFEKNQGVFGSPVVYDFDIGSFDVPLILHIYYLALTIRCFGDMNGFRVCEIGPGAGLFFKVFTDMFPDAKYTFVDLPGPLFINKKHVEYLGRQGNVEGYLEPEMVSNALQMSFDLVISDCAFNEIDCEVQKIYIEKIFNRSKRGRIAFYNATVDDGIIRAMGIEEAAKYVDRETKEIKMDLRVPTLYWDETRGAI